MYKMWIGFDGGIRLYDLHILLGKELTLPLISVFMSRVLMEYAYVLCFIYFRYRRVSFNMPPRHNVH